MVAPALDEVLFAPIEPFASGWLPVGHGHELYYEMCGNPAGQPVLFLHGGPGSGCGPLHRRFFDPERYLAILFDQRGCGRSRPGGLLEANTTAHLVDDMERLRQHLGIAKWLLFAGSWGVTLALAYALQHAARVQGLVLRGVFLASAGELQWFLEGAAQFAPAAHQALIDALPDTERSDLIQAYYRRVAADDTQQALLWASRWRGWEHALMTLAVPMEVSATAPEALINRMRVQLHYLAHNCFLTADILDGIPAIAELPAIIVQGSHDMICPPQTAWRLHRAWSGSQLELISGAGHNAFEPAIAAALITALARLASPAAGQEAP